MLLLQLMLFKFEHPPLSLWCMQLHDVLHSLGGTPLGYTPASGYLHTRSKSQRGSSFVGLPLDLVNQPELTEARVSAWCAQLSQELQQHAGGAGAGAAQVLLCRYCACLMEGRALAG